MRLFRPLPSPSPPLTEDSSKLGDDLVPGRMSGHAQRTARLFHPQPTLTCPACDATLATLGDRLLRRLAWRAWVVHISVMHGPANASPVWPQALAAPFPTPLASPSCCCFDHLAYTQLR